MPGSTNSKVYQADLGLILGWQKCATRAMVPVDALWSHEAKTAHRLSCSAAAMPGDVNYSEIVGWLSDNLPEDAVITNGAGNYTVWVHRFFRYKHYGTQLAPQSGAMGYGVPSGVAAGVCHRDRVVISFSGDGCFQMNGQEIGTAVQHGTKTIFVVVNNGMYGTIRAPGNALSSANLVPTWSTRICRTRPRLWRHGETVTKPQISKPLSGCRAFDGPALIDFDRAGRGIPTNTLSGIQKAAWRINTAKGRNAIKIFVADMASTPISLFISGCRMLSLPRPVPQFRQFRTASRTWV